MPLINPRLIKNQLPVTDIPASHLAILQSWRDSIDNRTIFKQKETALHSHFIQKMLIEVLGYQGFGGDTWTLTQEQKIGTGSVDVALGRFSHDQADILAPFELKGAKTKDLDAIMPGRHKSPVQQAWEYAIDAAGAQWVLVSNYLEIRLYAFGKGRQIYERWDLAQLTEPAEYARLQWLLSAEQLLSGATRKILEKSEQLDKEITNQLYKDYKNLREQLLANLKHNNLSQTATHLNELDLISLTQKILDRILFIAFAEDCGLLPNKTIAHAFQYNDPYNPRPVWENFKSVFRAIDQGNPRLKIPAYNGGLFAPDAELDALGLDDSLCKAFKKLSEYDFASEVSVTVLGHIFEQSISDIENLQAQVRGEADNDNKISQRKQHGVVYTPDHITRFIVEHTLGTYLHTRFTQLWDDMRGQRFKNDKWRKQEAEIQFWRDYQHILRTTRVLDPACGSGAFLVAAFDYLHAEYTRINNKLADLTGSYDVFDLDKEILNRNLYGVDLNAESIEITKLSLWLKTAKHGKQLNSLDDNMKVGNSLINDANYTDKPFDWAAAFPVADLSSLSQFDVILGNPPYVRQELISPIKPYLEQNYCVYHGVVDLYAYFFELGLRLLKPNGRMGYISSSTFFKTGSGENLRTFLMNNAQLENIVDFGDLQIFEGVTTYPAILTMRKAAAADPSSLTQQEHCLNMLVLKDTVPENLNTHFSQHAVPMRQADLDASAWRLEDERLLALRRKITANKPTLKEVYGSPYRGILTGLNEAFVIDRATRDALIKADAKSEELLKPFLEGKDLKKWRVESRDIYIIFTRRGVNIEQYPAILEYLEQFRERLEPKPKDWKKGKPWKGRKAGAYKWYEIQDTIDYYKKFEQVKIIYAHFSPNPLFSLESNASFSNDKSYIFPNVSFFELGLLNSYLYWFLIKSLCPFVRGGFYELRIQYMQTLPVPNTTNTQKQTIAQLAEACQTAAETRYQKQDSVRRRIHDLGSPESQTKLNNKLKNWWTLDFATFRQEIKKAFKQDIPLQERNDWEIWLTQERKAIEQLDKELQTLEQQLNTNVYELFDLNAEEIKLVEENK